MSTCCSAISVRIEQRGADDEHQRDRRSPRRRAPRACAPALVASRPPSRRPAFSCTRDRGRGRRQARYRRRQQRDQRREGEDAPSMRMSCSRGADAGAIARSPRTPHQREEQAGAAAGDREQRAFGQQLPHDLAAPGAERGADRDLAGAIRRARQQQAHDVRARDAEHQARPRARARAASAGRCRRCRRAAGRPRTRARSHSLSSLLELRGDRGHRRPAPARS